MSDPTMPDDEMDPAPAAEPGTEADPGVDAGDDHAGVADALRHTGVGTDDPNIIGDAGPLDVAPGSEGEADILFPDAAGVDHVEL